MQFPSLIVLLAACSIANAFDPRAAEALPAALAEPQRRPRTSCTTYLSTYLTTRTRGEVETSTTEILILQPTVTTVYATITSTSTFLVTENERTRTRTRTQTVSQCVVGQ